MRSWMSPYWEADSGRIWRVVVVVVGDGAGVGSFEAVRAWTVGFSLLTLTLTLLLLRLGVGSASTGSVELLLPAFCSACERVVTIFPLVDVSSSYFEKGFLGNMEKAIQVLIALTAEISRSFPLACASKATF